MAKQIDKDEFPSQLPFFELVRIPLDIEVGDDKVGDALIAWCPTCDEWFIVKLSWRTKAYGKYKTHNCPWCFRAARVPKIPAKER